jgi:hypothetical protein
MVSHTYGTVSNGLVEVLLDILEYQVHKVLQVPLVQKVIQEIPVPVDQEVTKAFLAIMGQKVILENQAHQEQMGQKVTLVILVHVVIKAIKANLVTTVQLQVLRETLEHKVSVYNYKVQKQH